MSGELTLSQFRYVTTDNRDFVIGEPSDISEDPRYLVFQVNDIPGYNSNPHIKAEKVGGVWQISISEDGITPLNFSYLENDNYFTSTNTFEAPVTFLNTVDIAGALTVGGTQLVFNDLAYLANNNTFTGLLNTFTHAVTINGAVIINSNLTVTGSTAILTVANIKTASKNILFNYNGATSSTINAGFDIEGDGAAVVAYVRNTATSMDIKSINKQPISFIGDAVYPISFAPITTLAKAGSYLLPPHTQVSSMLLTVEHASGINGFTSNSEVLINSDTWHAAQSGTSQLKLSYINNVTGDLQKQLDTHTDDIDNLTSLLSGVSGIVDDLTTDTVDEGTINLYFTQNRVRTSPLTNYIPVSGTLTATDTVLAAFGKVQKQITDHGANQYIHKKEAWGYGQIAHGGTVPLPYYPDGTRAILSELVLALASPSHQYMHDGSEATDTTFSCWIDATTLIVTVYSHSSRWGDGAGDAHWIVVCRKS